jgi:Cold shock proteins
MRDQGRLVEWFDDKGYGFIQPNDPAKDRVFLHIKDFARPGPRPIVGCALDYLVILDEQGRYRAQQVMYLKASQTKTAKTKLKHQAEASQKNYSRCRLLLWPIFWYWRDSV